MFFCLFFFKLNNINLVPVFIRVHMIINIMIVLFVLFLLYNHSLPIIIFY